MKIVIPTDGKKGFDESVSQHFGRCDTYTFLDDYGKIVNIIDNQSEHMGGKGLPPEIMRDNGADILLCRGLGHKAISLCRQFGIKVFISDKETVKEIFSSWKNGNIEEAENAVCTGH